MGPVRSATADDTAPVAVTRPVEAADGRSRPTVDAELARRIGQSWVELRRGASTRALRAHLVGDEDLVQGQMDALDLLARRDRKMRDLASRLRIDASTATRAVNRLVDDELVERYPAAEDGRVVMVRLTTEGRRVHAAVARRRARAMERILADFGASDCEQLADLLDRFIASVNGFVDTLD